MIEGTRLPDALAEALEKIAGRADVADQSGENLEPEIDWLRQCGALSDGAPASITGRTSWADDTQALALILRAVGRASVPVGRLYEGHINAAQLIGLLGSEALKAEARARIESGSLLGVWGADGTEPVRAMREGEGYVLIGDKDFCSGLGIVDFAVVSAGFGDGTQLFAAAVDDGNRADGSAWRMSGMRATTSGRFDFNGVRLGDDAAMGGINDYYCEPHFLGGMYRMCAVQVGGLEALLAAFARHLHHRNQAGDPLQQYRLGKCASYLMLAKAAVEHVAALVASDMAGDAVGHVAALMREGVESCVTEIFTLIERGAGTAAHRQGGAIDRLRRDLGLYIRQGVIDTRIKQAGARIAAAPEDYLV